MNVGLRERERRVLEAIAAGKSNREIAADMGRTKKTVQRISDEIRDTLNAKTRAHAVAIYLKERYARSSTRA